MDIARNAYRANTDRGNAPTLNGMHTERARTTEAAEGWVPVGAGGCGSVPPPDGSVARIPASRHQPTGRRPARDIEKVGGRRGGAAAGISALVSATDRQKLTHTRRRPSRPTRVTGCESDRREYDVTVITAGE